MAKIQIATEEQIVSYGKMNLKYTYFISYTYENGFGNTVIKYDKKVNKKTVETFLKEITNHIQKKNKFYKVAIINFVEIK